MGISCSPFGLCAVDRGYWPPRQILGSHPSPLGDILRWQHVFSSSITTSDGPHSTQVRTQSSHSDNWLNRPRLTLLKCDHVLFRWSLSCASRWNWSVFIGCFLVPVYTRTFSLSVQAAKTYKVIWSSFCGPFSGIECECLPYHWSGAFIQSLLVWKADWDLARMSFCIDWLTPGGPRPRLTHS